VAATGETVNIVDAYEDARFDSAVDNGKDFRHRSILCMPIVHSGAAVTGDGGNGDNSGGDNSGGGGGGGGSSSSPSFSLSNKQEKDRKGVLGVFQLVNKFDDLPFTKNDENFVEAFAIFCGMGISNVHNYERAIIAMAKQEVN